MAQRNVVGRGEVLRREGIQRADINVANGIAFAGADGGQMAAGNDGQRAIAAQRAGLMILFLIIVADGVQQLLLFFPTGVAGLADDQLARA